MIRMGLGLVVAAFCAAPLAAEVIDCSFKPGKKSYITDRYIFSYDPAKAEAVVIDGFIKFKYENPIAAKVLSATEDKIVFTWTVDVGDVSNPAAIMYYRQTFNPQDKKAKISAVAGRIGGEAITFSAAGSCTVEKE